MSEGGWIPSEREPARLPSVEDLPTAPEGYDPQAVREAFDAFYRHAAELDSTLRTLEAVETFQRNAAELRADIRVLRAAAWGPTASPRSDAWQPGYRARPRSGPGGAISDAFPRVVVETAFILLVAVGAAVGGVSTPLVVALVAAAWVIVGAAEVVSSVAGPRRRRQRAAVAYPAPAAAEPAPTVAGAPIEMETGEHPATPSEEPEVAEPRVEAREEAPAQAEAARKDVVVALPEPEEPEPEPAPVAADPWEAGPELPAVEPAASAAAPAGSRLRFWRRRREPEEEALYPEHSGHVQVIAVRPAHEETEHDHPVAGVQPTEGWQPPAEYDRPAAGKLRRGRR